LCQFFNILNGFYPQVIHVIAKNWWITPFSERRKACYNPGGEKWGIVVKFLPKWRR
jgi:hypothetical protein